MSSAIKKGVLYSSKVCPFANRVEIALFETIWKNKKDNFKDTAIDRVEIDLQNKPEWYLKDVYPAGKVPALKINEPSLPVLPESSILAEFVLAEFGEPTYAKMSNYERASAKCFAEQAFPLLFQPYYAVLKSTAAEDRENAAKLLNENLVKLNNLLGAGPNADGEFYLPIGFTVADIFVITPALRLRVLGKVRNQNYLDLDKPELARLNKWFNACLKRPSVADSFDEAFVSKIYKERFP